MQTIQQQHSNNTNLLLKGITLHGEIVFIFYNNKHMENVMLIHSYFDSMETVSKS